MIKNKIIYYPIILLAVFLVYLYTANAFIYYRIERGALSFLKHEPKIFMTSDNSPLLTYAALGDSLTSGAGAKTPEESYPYLLSLEMSATGKNIKLQNFSTPGYKTQDLIDVWLTPAINSQPDIITVLIGVNDIHNHIAKEQFRKNYQTIIERLQAETKAKIYLINIPYIGSNTAIVPPLDYYFETETNEFNKIIKELADAYHLDYLDLNSATKDLFKTDGLHYAADSFHPSAYGYKLWADIIYDRLHY